MAALIRELDAGPAVVFGSSSGAQVALQVLIDYPELVDTLFCHEVPVYRGLPYPLWGLTARITWWLIETLRQQKAPL